MISWLVCSPASVGWVAKAQRSTTPNLKIAFFGDQALGSNAVAVLNLIKQEKADAVLHAGDLDYLDNPAAWEAQINNVLGADFPYFVVIGNHDELAWRGSSGYQQYVINRFNRLGITWSGNLGVQSVFHFKGLFFVLTPPGIGNGFDSGQSHTYIRDQLAADNSVWTISSWHKNQRLMQVGAKLDETGWEVYEESRKGGAIIATAHEHSYSRTQLLSSMINQTIASNSNALTLTKGNSFAFVSGLGGHSVRPAALTGTWWGAISASSCVAGDPICQLNGNFGALFGVFNVDGQPNKAYFYFKDINGRIVDSFTVISNVELPAITGLSPASAEAGSGGLSLLVTGDNFGNESRVFWNAVERPTTFVSPTQLIATIPPGDLGAAGIASITVSSPGGTSNNASFTITPARIIPVINSISPTSAEAGANSFTLSISGDNFVSGSVVRWNGGNRPTTFISSRQLTAAISALDIAGTGAVPVTVSNPDGNSNEITFTIGAPSIRLVTEENSERAVALDSMTMVRDPFLLVAPNYLTSLSGTRVMVFSSNLSLMPGDGISSIIVQGEDWQNRIYPLTVEFVGKPSGPDWLTQIVLSLPDPPVAGTDLWVRVFYRGAVSNRVLIKLRASN